MILRKTFTLSKRANLVNRVSGVRGDAAGRRVGSASLSCASRWDVLDGLDRRDEATGTAVLYLPPIRSARRAIGYRSFGAAIASSSALRMRQSFSRENHIIEFHSGDGCQKVDPLWRNSDLEDDVRRDEFVHQQFEQGGHRRLSKLV